MKRGFVGIAGAMVLLGAAVETAWAGAAPVAPTHQVALMSWSSILVSIIYGAIGIAMLIIGYYVFDLLTPYSTRKELVDDQNVAVGIVVGAVVLGIAIIIGAAIMP